MELSEQPFSKQFTIFDNYKPFSPYLYSVWNVRRNNTYLAEPSRHENENLFCFIRTVSGSGVITTTKGKFTLPPDSLILINELSIVKYSPTDGVWEYNWYNFIITDPVPFFEECKIYHVPKSYEETRLLAEMTEAMKTYDEFGIRLTTSMFVELVYRWANDCRRKINSEMPHYDEIVRTIAYINGNLKSDLSVDELAANCYLSARRFRSVFHSFTGLSPKQYVCRQKLKNAALLLRTSHLTINQIALDLNYSSPYHLSRDFKNFYGVSPAKFREENK